MTDMLQEGVMVALGAYRFATNTEGREQLSRVTEYRWMPQERVGQRPSLQFLGVGEDTITISGAIYPTFKGGLYQIDGMRDDAARGKPMRLIDGTGSYFDKWVIVSVSDDRTLFDADNNPRKIEFQIALSHYGNETPWRGNMASGLANSMLSGNLPAGQLLGGVSGIAAQLLGNS